MLTLSVPAAPRFLRTALKADSVSSGSIRPVSEWNLTLRVTASPSESPQQRTIERIGPIGIGWEAFLNRGGFSAGVAERPEAAAVAKLTSSVVRGSSSFFPTEFPFLPAGGVLPETFPPQTAPESGPPPPPPPDLPS